MGDTSVVIFKMEATESKISTIVVRGATENYMDDIERAIDDGVNTYKGKFRISKLILETAVIIYYPLELKNHMLKCEIVNFSQN